MVRFEAVFFDFGNTLWHFPDPRSIERILDESVRRIDDAFSNSGFGLSVDLIRQVSEDLSKAVSVAEQAADDGDLRSPDYVEIARQVVASNGKKLDRQSAERFWTVWNVGGQFLGRRIHPDTYETLDWLRTGGYRLGAITNRALGGPAFIDELRTLRLYDYFETVSISADVGYRKPHPAIFEYTLAEMRVVPEQCMMVGDRPRADIEGAKALGMTAVWMRNSSKVFTGRVRPDYTIERPRQLIDLPIFKPPCGTR